MTSPAQPIENLAAALQSAYPELAAIRGVAGEDSVYVVGGAVRDLLLGRGRADLDLVVEGNAAALATRLGAEAVEHERFATVKVVLDGHELDLASARSETYPHPGALPLVAPAASIEEDLGRRDFSLNAMAISLAEGSRLIDPHDGRADLEAGLLRVLHRGSFEDDPTRALRAARYAARLGFELEPETAVLLRAADLDTVSADRRRAELLRLAAEATAPRGFALLCEWGLLAPREEGVDLVARTAALAAAPPWRQWLPAADRAEAVLAAAIGPAGGERDLAAARPASPSQGVDLARGHDPVELLLARALGAEWVEEYVGELELGRARDRRRRSDRRRGAAGPGPRTWPGRGAAGQARRRGRGARAGAGAGTCRRPRRVGICFVWGMEWREADGVRWLQADLGGAGAAFATRIGGISVAPFDRLNLGILTADSDQAVVANRERLAAALGLDPARIPIGLQVHGTDLAVHSGPQLPSPFLAPGAEIPEVDGHVVSAPGLAPLILTADCLPVALSGPGGVAMLHCGWRGLAAGILAAGAEAVAATDAAIGPGIGPCCYEVGTEVLDAFADLGQGVAAGRMLDLVAVARRLLEAAGIERIQAAGLCTSCEPELFFSHRRDAGRTGRQGSLAWIEQGDEWPA